MNNTLDGLWSIETAPPEIEFLDTYEIYANMELDTRDPVLR